MGFYSFLNAVNVVVSKFLAYFVLVPLILAFSAAVIAIHVAAKGLEIILKAYFRYPVGLLLIVVPSTLFFLEIELDPKPYRSAVVYILTFTQGMICIGIRLIINIFEDADRFKNEESGVEPRVP